MIGQVYDPDAEPVRALVTQGERPDSIIKETIPSYLALAQDISALGNTGGGTVVIGGLTNPPAFREIDWRQLTNVFEKANAQLKEGQGAMLRQVAVDGSHVGLIRVPRSARLVATVAGAYTREGTKTRPMTEAEVAAKIHQGGHGALADLVAAIALNTQTIASLNQTVQNQTGTISTLQSSPEYAQSLSGQWKTILVSALVSGVVGFFFGFAASYLVNVVWNQKLVGP